METTEQSKKRTIYVPTTGEEIANAVSHGAMSFVTLLALPFAAVWAYLHDVDGVLASVSVSVFVVSIFLMFLASTLYHSMNPHSRHKEVFHILDHIFIYVAIAGSYTPIALSVIGGGEGGVRRCFPPPGRADHKPAALSGGEQQRVAIARALVNRPALLLADEPSGNLDSKNREEIHALFFRLRDELGQTTLIVTHDEELASTADRKIAMRDGIIE